MVSPVRGDCRVIDNTTGKLHFCRSVFFICSAMDAKKRQRASADAMAPFNDWRSPKETISEIEYCMRSRSAAHWALSSSTLTARMSEINRPIAAWLLGSSFDIHYPGLERYALTDGARFLIGKGCEHNAPA